MNGKSSGRVAAWPTSHAAWTSVAYAPGTIEARAYKKGSNTTLASKKVSTTGPAAAVRASFKDGMGAKGLVADNSDVALVQVEVVDKDGVVVPTSANNVTFSVSGAGKLIGTGNGDPSSHVPDKSATRPVYHGLVLAVVQSTHDAGSITVTATAAGLGSSKVTVQTRKPAVARLRL